MERPRPRRRPSLLLLLGVLGAAGPSACDSVRPDDGPFDPMADPIATTAACPPAHLVIGLRQSDGHSSLARRSATDLSACRGQALSGQVHGVGGLPDPAGSEIVGVDDRVVRLLGDTQLWEHEAPSYGLEATSFAVLALDRYAVAVLWTNSYGNGERLEVLDANTGELMHAYESLRGTPVAITEGLDGIGDRVAVLDQYEALREAQVVIGAPSLGGASERAIAMPRTGGSLASAATLDGRVAIGSPRGVVWWSRELPPAALGPVACSWPLYAGEQVPADCDDYDAAVPVPGTEARFVTACSTRTESGSRLVVAEVDHRGGCRLLVGPGALGANVSVAGMAWTGTTVP